MARVGTKPAYRSTRKKTARPEVWLWLTAPIAVLVATATVSELLVGNIFRGDELNFVAQAIGQDYVTLTVALPVLVVGGILAGRGSGRARLVWLGTLAYVLYTYAIYAFHVRFNPLFLVYVALVGLSLYALIGGLATTNFEAIKARFSRRTPVKAVSIFLVLLATLFYLTWLGETVPALLAGGVPQSAVDSGTPTNAVHVLDMAWVLPAMLLAAVWLWRGRALGYVLAGALLTFGALIVVAVMAMVASMSLYGQDVAIAEASVFGTVALVIAAVLILYLRGLKAT